ncbi:crotonobetainyl-CoA hydratase [Alphaproteobacteria bacterium KMM 3653]|uniref:Crotonobetainyl-CoA hydratase n=1 Tax=Harenicola maris TaxID=2841044 RepID=A0AAP2CQN6_9RHOB|nr:crotonobetainyl-CoA hydratase [Harenicola maris]
MTDPVTTERHGRVFLITLNRPKANAIDAATSQALGAAFEVLQNDQSLSVGVITGTGRFFSAGWDLKAAAEGEAPDADQGVGGFAGLTEYWGLTKPVIAAVNGLALGGGFELALAADMIVAAEGAEFALPEATLGIVADAGATIRLPRRLPRPIAMELLMTGRRATAAELERWGLINRVTSPEDLISSALELAAATAACAPLSLQAIKEIDALSEGLSVEDAYAATRNTPLPAYSGIYTSEDAAEGMAAFAERRLPDWKGK